MTVRPVAPADADALLALWNRSAPHDPLTPALLREKVWGDPDFDAARALLATDDRQRLVGFGVGVRWGPPHETRGTVKMLCVAPERRREGIGRRLLATIEDRLRADGATTCRIAEASPNYLVPGLDPRDTPGWLFVQRHGYERVGEALNLTVDLDAEAWSTAAAEARLAETGITVRRAAPADRAAVSDFLTDRWPAWVPEVRAALSRTPPALHLALRGSDLLGFSAYDANNVGTGWFGPMGTAEAARGLGIGRVLCRRCLADLKAQGLRRATIPWVAPVRFYAECAGATVSRVFHRFEKRL